jgi:zinc transporter ZupT
MLALVAVELLPRAIGGAGGRAGWIGLAAGVAVMLGLSVLLGV